jgi:NAD(P)H-flavin reductase
MMKDWITQMKRPGHFGYSVLRGDKLKKGDSIRDLIGPLGMVPHVEKYGTAVVIAGGCGAA